MNKSYVFLIGILIVLAVAVGAFAFYRSANAPKTVPRVVKHSPLKTPPITQTPPPPPMSEAQQVAKNNTLPLTITSPQDNSEVISPTLIVSGTTSPNADVSVNDKDLKTDQNGKFSSTVILEAGQNYILVVSSNENGASEWEGTVTYTPSQ